MVTLKSSLALTIGGPKENSAGLTSFAHPFSAQKMTDLDADKLMKEIDECGQLLEQAYSETDKELSAIRNTLIRQIQIQRDFVTAVKAGAPAISAEKKKLRELACYGFMFLLVNAAMGIFSSIQLGDSILREKRLQERIDSLRILTAVTERDQRNNKASVDAAQKDRADLESIREQLKKIERDQIR